MEWFVSVCSNIFNKVAIKTKASVRFCLFAFLKRDFFILIFVLSFCGGLSSCSKDNGRNSDESEIMLPKWIKSKTWDFAFEYDRYDRMSRAIKTEGNILNVIEITYPKVGVYKIMCYRIHSNDTTVIIAEEKDERIDLSGYNRVNDTKMTLSGRYYLLDSQGRVTEHWDGDKSVSYSYNEKGNVLSRGSKSYTYDNRNGAFSNIKTPWWILIDELDFDQMSDPFFFVNNVKRIKQNNKDQVEYMYSYTNNYPTAIQIKNYDTGDIISEVTFEY